MEVDLQSLFGLHVTCCAQLYSLAETPHPPGPPPPPSPRIGTPIRGRYWSAKIDDISLQPHGLIPTNCTMVVQFLSIDNLQQQLIRLRDLTESDAGCTIQDRLRVFSHMKILTKVMKVAQSKRACVYSLCIMQCKENPICVFLFWELRSLSPNFHIHVSGLVHIFPCWIPRIGPYISLLQNRQTDPGNI